MPVNELVKKYDLSPTELEKAIGNRMRVRIEGRKGVGPFSLLASHTHCRKNYTREASIPRLRVF